MARDLSRRPVLFTNGRIFTGTGEDDFVSAFRATDGHIDWVGEAPDAPISTDVVDLGGRTVVPGLIDSHTHPALLAGTAAAVECFPPAVTDVDGLVDRLRVHPARGAGDGWILGRGYDETFFPGGVAPTATDLDRVSTTQPVLVWRCDAHSAVCNTMALVIAGITATTPDPDGARFERDATGRPTGVLTEIAAVNAVARHIPPPTEADQVATLVGLGQEFASRGIVAVCDLLSTRITEPLARFRQAADAGMATTVALYPGWDPAHPLADLDPADREGRVRIAGVKLVLDGAYSNRTASVHDPYPDSCDHGLVLIPDDQVRAAAAWARRNGVQVAVHAMGDRALDRVLDLLGDEEPWLTEVPSVRIEHATIVDADYVRRLGAARMTFGIATHTVFFFAEHTAYARNLRAEHVPNAYPIRRLYETVAALALSSDRPATSWNDADDVFLSIEAAVRRRAWNGAEFGPRSAITAAQALLLYTGRAARLSPLPGVGRIRPGAEASFAVLDRDVFTVPDDEISQVRVAETWIRGSQVYVR